MRRRLLRTGEVVGAVVAGGLLVAGATFAGTVVICEWLKARDGRDSPVAFGLLLASTCFVPLSALVGGWCGWRLVIRPGRRLDVPLLHGRRTT